MNRKALTVMICGCAILLLSMGTRQSMGLFLGPVSETLGLDTQVFALAIGLQNLALGLGQPIMGSLADRFGTARMLAISASLYVVGLVILSHATGPMDLYVACGIFIGFGASGSGYSLILGAVGRAASPEKRSLCLSVVSAFGSLGQLVAAPANQKLIASYGTATTFLILAIALGALVPLSAAMSGKAADTHDPLTEGQTLKQAVREALNHGSYSLLITGYFVCGFQLQFVATHLPHYLSLNGQGEMAGLAVGLIGFFNFFGTLLFGLLAQKYSKKRMLSVIYAVRSLAFIVFLILPVTQFSVLLFAAWLGFLWLGTVPLTTGLVATMFGVRYLSTLGAFVFVSHQLGSFAGSWLGGVVFDMTGSYDLMWKCAIALGFVAAIIHLPIKEARAGRPAAAPAAA